jgi:arylsulfatase A-like enzyme
MTLVRLAAHAVRFAGAGALVGGIAGGLVGLRRVAEHRGLAHGAWWLSMERVTPPAAAGAAWGLGAGCGLAAAWLLLRATRRRPNGARLPGSPSRTSVVVGWVGIGVLVLLGALRTGLPALRHLRAEGHPPVILVSIDTLRADRLGVMGNLRGLTPHLDRLGREGVVFEAATAAAPWTLPSHVSLFASQLPLDHGVRVVGSRIPPGLCLLSERFRDAGYRTAAFTGGGYVSWGYGFDQGFEIYEDHDESAEDGPSVLAEAALRWIRGVGDEPFFVFVHTYEPHHPYSHDDFADPADAGRLSVRYNADGETPIENLTAAERRYAVGLYDSDVAHADRVIGAMLQSLRRDAILDRAIVVVLSDHGEDCWDHDAVDIPRHGHTLYQEMLHVPLIVRAPGIVRAGSRIRTPIGLIDVAPTLLELAGLRPAPSFAGRSLAASCRTGTEPSPRPLVAESTRYGPDRLCLRDGDLKVVVAPSPGVAREERDIVAPPIEVFDLAADPLERASLGAPSGTAAEMIAILMERATALRRPAEVVPGEAEGAEPETIREQLRSLGYFR